MKHLVIHTDGHTYTHTHHQEPREKINYQNSRGREAASGRRRWRVGGAPKVDVL